MTRTAREVVETYNFVVWNERNFDLAHELFAETVIRHEVGEAHTLTREQAVKRIQDVWALFGNMIFELPVVVAGQDNEHVAIVYDTTMTGKEGDVVHSGSMEIFRVIDGRIAEVWNCGRKEGRWD
ncbi:ester cyclase [Mycolicibacterium septicum DSM 44393]|uniref:Ester cyclase n=1 Tax=Mycolicibacterium septicum DSM 44393 TaxID=1341646 RepID=A0A7X6MM80_9MYCO|nr:ester cyclase [Mycolicibacterium septicum]NKZ11385.1 ester cyclase [Mycolicibacterium septicum DSM 44393]